MPNSEAWLAPFSWEMVTAQNAVLCAAKDAFHGPTTDGHEVTRELWNASHQSAMTLSEAMSFLRRCHRLAPFCFYNGNTFASIAAVIVKHLELEPQREHVVRSLAGHIVAGVATEEEEKAFREFSDSLG